MQINQQQKDIPTLNANPHKPNQDSQLGEYAQIRNDFKSEFEEAAQNGATGSYIIDGVEYTAEEIDKHPSIFKAAKTAKLTTYAGNWTKTVTLGQDDLGSTVIETKYNSSEKGSIFERTKLTKDQYEVKEYGIFYNGADRVYESSAYDVNTKKMLYYYHDINVDGKHELEQSFYENGMVAYESADNNSDGYIDRRSEYDRNGNLVYEYDDNNSNGTGKTKEFINGKLKTTNDTRTLGEKISDWWNKRD